MESRPESVTHTEPQQNIMSAVPKQRLSPAEYLAMERKSEIRHQYYKGEVFAMGGASRAHNRISMNIGTELNHQLRDKPCERFMIDMRVKVDPSGLYTYPDIVVVCDKPEFEDERVDTLLNPQLIIEVLSKTTESYDRGKKFEHYRRLESLTDYLLVSQDEAHIEHFTKNADGHWVLSEGSGLDTMIELPTIHCRLALGDVYANVELASE